MSNPFKSRVGIKIASFGILEKDQRRRVVHDHLKSCLALPQALLRLAALGEIASDLGETAQLSGAVPESSDHDARPKLRAVLSYPPTFIFKPAIGGGPFEPFLRFAALKIFAVIKTGEVLANDLVRPIPLNLFRTQVPADDDTIGIQHEDGIVTDGFD